ncbi:MAG: response regulator transcription factor [Myxococcota bacterium]
MMQKIRILIADDHTMVRQGIRMMLLTQQDMEVIGEAANGREAVQKAEELDPDVVILDLSMPIMNGLEAARIIAKQNPRIGVLVLTMHLNEEYAFQVLSCGAKGYMIKESSAEEMIKAVRNVYRHETYIDSRISKEVIDAYIKRANTSDSRGVPKDILTPREREVLKLIAEGRSNKEIAQLLDLSVKTVDVHRTNLMKKLNIHDVATLVKFAIKKGLIQVG